MLDPRSPLVSFRILSLILSALSLLGTGCTSTKPVSPDRPRDRNKITAESQDQTARVRLTGGQTLKLTNLYVAPDSTTGRTPEGTDSTVANSAIQEIVFVDRGTGFLQGAGIGFTIPFVAGLASTEPFSTLAGLLLSAPAALVGGLIGTAVGRREAYHFSSDSLAPQTAAPPPPNSLQSEPPE